MSGAADGSTRVVTRILVAAVVSISCTASAWAQQAAGIAGIVRDSEGLPIPGVTVEASSPALIQQSVTVFSDGEGRYTIVDLRPGTYTVTFSLVGFSTVRREGIVLNAGFTATVDIALNVGALEETITVTGAAPVVDTQTIRQQETLTTTDLTSLPAGNIGLQTLAYVTPGFAVTQADVGGTRDTWSAQGAYTGFHGKAGTRASFDGFRNQYFVDAASGVGYITDQGVIEELQVELSGMGADSGSGTVNLNVIPKSGGNQLRATIDGFFSNGAMQGSNIDDELRAFGIDSGAEIGRIYRMGAQIGGPFVRDRIWFFGSIAYWGSRNFPPGAYQNPLQGQSGNPLTATLFYPGQPGTGIPVSAYDTTRRASNWDWYRNHALRTTAQITDRQRVAFFFDIQKSCRCTTGFTGANAIEATTGWDWYPSGVAQGTWTMPINSRLLVEAGVSWQVANWVNFAASGAVTRDDRSILETATNYRYGAPAELTAPQARTGRSAQRFSLSYVTGTHNVKVGIMNDQGFNDEKRSRQHHDTLNWDFQNGRPIRIQYRTLPYYQQERQHLELGVYVQDAWSITDQFTATLGLRFDYVNMGYLEGDVPAGPFVPARRVEERDGIPTWKDWNPRYGLAYDVFGNGRTAVRFSAGRYNALTRSSLTKAAHPLTASIVTAFRNWNDLLHPEGDPRRGNYIPDCDLANFSQNGECGGMSNVNFGQYNPNATTFDESITQDNREYLWDYNLEVQHEVTRGLSVSVGYNYNFDGANLPVTDNMALGPEHYDEFCVNIPADSRIPGGGGYEQCGYYDVKPAFFGQGLLRVTDAKEFGTPKRYWHGINVNANGRLPYGITVGGGIDAGQNTFDRCFTVDVPNQVRLINNTNSGGPFCRSVTSMMDNLDIRLRGSVPLRGGFNVSAIYRNTRGASINATMSVSSANVRFLDPTRTALTTAQTINLNAPDEDYGDRFSQLDFALSKSFDFNGVGRLRTSIDLYNALNSNAIQAVTGTYSTGAGSRYLRPTQVLDPRVLRVTASLDF